MNGYFSKDCRIDKRHESNKSNANLVAIQRIHANLKSANFRYNHA
ncbi:hypothetical protein ACWIWK_00670 [Helicobacter sp. 23-1048]